jgi:hypothetical protein
MTRQKGLRDCLAQQRRLEGTLDLKSRSEETSRLLGSAMVQKWGHGRWHR